MTRRDRHRLATTTDVLGVVAWVVLGVGMCIFGLLSRAHAGITQSFLTYSLGIFFIILIVRLSVAAVGQRQRRGALFMLLFAVLLWAAGSAVVNGAGQPDLTKFPAPGELLFLASYAGMAGFLILDAGKRTGTAGATWLETSVICGGSVCLAGSVLVTPAAHALGQDGLPLLLALLYPLIDTVLALLVVTQLALHARGRLRDAAGLLIGFLLFTIADSEFLIHLSGGTYSYSVTSIAMWGAGFALIVGSACRVRTAEMLSLTGRGVTTLVVAAGLAASFVLAFQENGTIRNYLLVPALATLTAAGARLALALRAAHRTAEAIALSRSDDLTSLPNRRAVLALLDDKLTTSDPFGLMILDLDGFKDINDTLGHGAGDAILREIATRTRATLDPAIMIARLGGDEFAVVSAGSDRTHLTDIADQVLEAVRQPLSVDGLTLSTDGSIGITLRERNDKLSSEILRRADVAMYDAKQHRSGYAIYDADGDDFSRDKLKLADELRRAIGERQLILWYQPQIDATTRRVCGLEALARWNHPTHGITSPAIFLPVARRAGLMQALSEEIGRIAVSDLRRWQSINIFPRVAINCAPPELMSGIFLPRLNDMLLRADVRADRIVIEVTEDSFLSEPARARALLLDVRRAGFQVSIDDYGTGFSSLSYLRDLPVQELKIDRSFVAAMGTDPRSRTIVASTLQMASALGLRTVAEGVEDASTTADLVAMGADVLQGFYLSRPLPPEEVERHIEDAYVLS